MTDEKIREVLEIYRKLLDKYNVSRKPSPHDVFPLTDKELIDHLYYMLDQIDSFLRQGHRDKAFRWLGFMQGCLWCLRFYTLEDLKNHNKS